MEPTEAACPGADEKDSSKDGVLSLAVGGATGGGTGTGDAGVGNQGGTRGGLVVGDSASFEARRRCSDGDQLMPGVPQYRKHSSGDLHSRLKTRKLLGVGETDDGDVHRSKLSQILGHSDQLYVRLPPGLRVWQCLLAIMFTVIALWALMFPAYLYDLTFEAEEGKHLTLPIRLYGVALLSMSLLFWGTFQCQDRDVIRMSLMSSVIYFALQTIVTGAYLFSAGTLARNSIMLLGSRVVFALISFAYYHAIGCKLVSIRRSNSSKDVPDSNKENKEKDKDQ